MLSVISQNESAITSYKVSAPANMVTGTHRLPLAGEVATMVPRALLPGPYQILMSFFSSFHLLCSFSFFLYTGCPVHPQGFCRAFSNQPPKPCLSVCLSLSLSFSHCSQPHTNCKTANTFFFFLENAASLFSAQ